MFAQVVVAELGKEAGVLVADHGDARGGGNYDDIGVLIEADEVPGLGKRLGTEAGIGVHLAAAGLLGTEFDFDAEPLEQSDNSTAGFRKKCVVVARDEERCAHWRHRNPTAM